MGSEPGSVKSKEQKRKEKKEDAKPKTYLVQKYALGPKVDQERFTSLKEKGSRKYAAVIVQTLAASKEPVAFPALLDAVMAKAQHGKGANVEANLRWYVNHLKKKGLIKSVDEKVEAKSQDEARGVE